MWAAGALTLLLGLPGCPNPADDDDAADDDAADDDDAGDDDDDDTAPAGARVPAEWEPHAGTWMQWPRQNEHWSRPDHARIIAALSPYEPVHIIVDSASAQAQAEEQAEQAGAQMGQVFFHTMAYDWSWVRDNGPTWIERDGELIVQDWGFNCWGEPGAYQQDDAVPCNIAEELGLSCDTYDLINERGNLEFNGEGILIANWTCVAERNPSASKEEVEALFEEAFGIEQVVWLDGASAQDLTDGHTDGIARFIDASTVAVARYSDQDDPDAALYEDAADTIAAAGLDVVRIDVPGEITYLGEPMAANYTNWLVANGVVVVNGFAHTQWDAAAKAEVEGFFPDHDVVVLDTRELWYNGGGVHCVTNDQPAL